MFVRNIRAGDVVLLREGVRVTARGVQLGELGEERKPVAYLFDTDGRQWSLHPGDVVELVRRPRPEGKTESDMLQAVELAMRGATRVGTLPPGKTFDLTIHQCRVELDPFRSEDALRAVGEALDAYVLGEPETKS